MPKGKAPALMLYTGDWLKDPELSACCPATRGIWADWLCRMREQVAAGRRPRLSCSVEAFARLGRCSADEALRALVELQETDAASVTMSRDVTLRHADVTDVVTLENRRMSREWKASQGAAERQREKRKRDAESQDSNADVTPPLHLHLQIQEEEGETKASPPCSSDDERERGPSKAERDFESWWPLMPPKARTGKAKALRAWGKLPADQRPPGPVVLFLDFLRESEAEVYVKEGGQFLPHGAAFVIARPWEDDRESYPAQRPSGHRGRSERDLGALPAVPIPFGQPGHHQDKLRRRG